MTTYVIAYDHKTTTVQCSGFCITKCGLFSEIQNLAEQAQNATFTYNGDLFCPSTLPTSVAKSSDPKEKQSTHTLIQNYCKKAKIEQTEVTPEHTVYYYDANSPTQPQEIQNVNMLDLQTQCGADFVIYFGKQSINGKKADLWLVQRQICDAIFDAIKTPQRNG